MKPGLCPDLPFYVNDWLSSPAVSAMTPAEEGAFIRLLCYAWNEPDCTLPDDDAKLAALSRLGDDWTRGSGAKLREKFISDPNLVGRVFNPRLREERHKQKARVDATVKQRTAAANARWSGMRKQSGRNAAASRPQSGSNASSPVSRHSGVNVISAEKELKEVDQKLASMNEDRASWNEPEFIKQRQTLKNRRESLLKTMGRTA